MLLAAGAGLSSDPSAGLIIGFVGLVFTLGAIATIVFLATRLGKSRSAGINVLVVLGMVACLGFLLAGLAATGCGAMLVFH